MMVDFHCHILPKMDDGSDSINTSLAMLRAEHTQGVNRVVLTPHFYCEEESIEAFLQRRKKAFSALQTAISDQPHTGDIPELCLGAEVAMSSALAQMDLQPLCISGTNVLLLELPYYRRFRLKDVETIINRNDIQVVFAHIERFSRLWNKETFAAVMELPVYKQINCSSLCHARWRQRRQLLRWLSDEEVHLLGTDAHNLTSRPVNFQAAAQLLLRKQRTAELEACMELAEQLTEDGVQ